MGLQLQIAERTTGSWLCMVAGCGYDEHLCFDEALTHLQTEAAGLEDVDLWVRFADGVTEKLAVVAPVVPTRAGT